MEEERILRIRRMEERLDRISAAQKELRLALDAYLSAQDALGELTAWYESPLWREDYEADEAGLIPAGLKRGVLSQDGIYDLLSEDQALRDELRLLLRDTKGESEC